MKLTAACRRLVSRFAQDVDSQVAFLNLVDLAGSERQATSGTSGRRLKEGSMINKSLSALALVVSKLGEAATRTRGKRALVMVASCSGEREWGLRT